MAANPAPAIRAWSGSAVAHLLRRPVGFHYLPEKFRLTAVKKHLGPSGGWFAKDKVIGKVPLHLGCEVESANIRDGMVRLQLRAADGTKREISAEHIIAATGYKVDVERLAFLSKEVRSTIKTVSGTPILTSKFESSVPGLYFVGLATANSFGPLMRFAFGADFTARHLTKALTKSLAKNRAPAPSAASVAAAK